MKDQDYKNMIINPDKYFLLNGKKDGFNINELTDVFIELVHTSSPQETPKVEAFFHEYKNHLNKDKLFLNMIMLIRSNNTLFDSFLTEHRREFTKIFLQTSYPLTILQKYSKYLDFELTEQELNSRKEEILKDIKELDDFIEHVKNRNDV